MRHVDFSPLYRSTVGFDRMTRLLESALNGEDNGQNAYPPYNIERLDDDQYRITMAVAGFGLGDLEITAHPNLLIVQGKAKEQQGGTFLHRGIAGRPFEHRFELADHVRVNGADLQNGLLSIDLVREIPEALKPRKIDIQTNPALSQKVTPAQIEAPKAA